MSNDKNDELQVQIQYAMIEKLSASQQKQSKLLSLLDECVFECSDDFILTYVNSAWTRQLGYSENELIGMSLLQLAPKFSLISWAQTTAQSNVSDAQPQRAELQIMTKGNELRWFELRIVKSNQSERIGSLFDIQNHKEMEAKLRQKEEETRKLSLVASHTNNMVIITDSKGRIEWVNSSFERRTGYAKHEVYGCRPGDILQGRDTDKETVALMSQAIRTQQGFNVEIVNYTRAMVPYWVAIDASPVKDESGEVKHFIAIETDISKRVRAEKVALEAENNYRMVVDNINEVVLRLRPDGCILFMNHAWSDLVQREASQCVGIGIGQFVSEINQADVAQAITNFQRGSRDICRLELRMTCEGGPNTWVEMTMTPVGDSHNGKLTAIAATIVNVDSRVFAALALEDAKQLAEGLAQDRSRFLANISHEIRTPLNAMIGASDILQNTGLNQEQERFADMIQSSGSALLSILDDVLIYSRFEAGAVTLENRKFDLGVCIDEAIDIVSENALSKQIELVLNIHSKTPLNLIGDNVRLRQVMINLLANALKFTAEGHVSIKVECKVDKLKKTILHVSVEDSGIGIDEDKTQQLFAPFTQSDISTTRKYGGSGLGLAICRQICEVAGGKIDVESTLGEGSTFSFQFPVETDMHTPRKTLKHLPDNKGSKVWLVGKSKRLNSAVIEVLQRYRIAYEHFDTVEHLPSTLSSEEDFIVVTDPSIACECRNIIESNFASQGAPCLITIDVLGKSNRIQTNRNNELSVNGPFKASHFGRILEQLHELLGKASVDLSEDRKSSLDNVQFNSPNILVVEDNEQNQIIMQQFLQLCGCRVTLADHGGKALEILKTESVDIVLMDIQMPVMDGLTTTQHIRGSASLFQHVPIIAVTADAVYGDKERYLNAGMNAYLSKPASREELYRLLDIYMPFEKRTHAATTKAQRLINMRDLVNTALS